MMSPYLGKSAKSILYLLMLPHASLPPRDQRKSRERGHGIACTANLHQPPVSQLERRKLSLQIFLPTKCCLGQVSWNGGR